MENPFRKNGHFDLGYRVFVRVAEDQYGLPKSGNNRGYRVVGHVSRWIPEEGIGIPKEDAMQRVSEIKSRQTLVSRLIHPNAKMIKDIV